MITSIIIALVILCIIFCAIGLAQAKFIQQYKDENAALRVEINNAAVLIERINEYIKKNKKLEEAVNAEQTALEATPDGGLADRANNLFNNVRFNGGGDGKDAA